MKSKKILLDTNVVMDMLLAREPFAKDVKTIFNKAINEDIEIYITSLSVSTIISFMEKTTGHIAARNTLKNLLQIVKSIDITMTDIEKAFDNSVISDTEDAIQVQGAIKAGLDLILTRDEALLNARDQKIKIMSPADFLNS